MLSRRIPDELIVVGGQRLKNLDRANWSKSTSDSRSGLKGHIRIVPQPQQGALHPCIAGDPPESFDDHSSPTPMACVQGELKQLVHMILRGHDAQGIPDRPFEARLFRVGCSAELVQKRT